jgi:hypothetical protein
MPAATRALIDPSPVRRTVPPRPAAIRLALLSCTAALAATGLVGGVAPAAQASSNDSGPSAPAEAPKTIEPLATYQPQSTCSPEAKPGTLAMATLLLEHYDAGRNGGISRNCSIGGRSEHKEGRAFDWMLRADRSKERAVAEKFIDWLLDKGPDDKAAYNARRLGVMYVIWNRRIWSADHAKRGWLRYSGPNPHVDHIHISLTWSGAMKKTSFWTGEPADVGRGTEGDAPESAPLPEEDDDDDD